eukprot:scaffold365410_cov45-Prasinocladus_malaysianus.AAC.1
MMYRVVYAESRFRPVSSESAKMACQSPAVLSGTAKTNVEADLMSEGLCHPSDVFMRTSIGGLYIPLYTPSIDIPRATQRTD